MAGEANDEDDTFRVEASKEVCFMNRDLQERGFECLVEHHDIERVTSNEDCIHISCVVTVLEEDCIEVPPPSVQRSISESVAAQVPVEVVFHVSAECRVIRVTCVNVAKVYCLALKLLQLLEHTYPDAFSVLIKYTREGSLRRRQICETLLLMPGLIYSRSPTCTNLKG
jgi:hypothetical protein